MPGSEDQGDLFGGTGDFRRWNREDVSPNRKGVEADTDATDYGGGRGQKTRKRKLIYTETV